MDKRHGEKLAKIRERHRKEMKALEDEHEQRLARLPKATVR
jgi:hypothetical protein